LKSLIGCDTPFLALTATATKKTKQKIFDILEISNPYEISEDPNRPNILYAVEKMDGTITDQFLFLVNELNSLSSGDKFHIFHSIASDINISTSIYPPLKQKPPLKSS
jgi:superfamily II DNA helicase RecQ